MYLIVCLFILLSLIGRWWIFRHDKTALFYGKTKKNMKIISLCKKLECYNDIPIWCNLPVVGGFVQSVYNSQIRKGPRHDSQKIQVDNNYGPIAVHWVVCDLPSDAPILCIIPGIAGHYDNDYVKNFVHFCKDIGKYRVVVMNWPGCGDSPLTCRIIPFGEVSDLSLVMHTIHHSFPKAPIFIVGFSAGSNLLVRYLGEVGTNDHIHCSVIMGNGYDAEAGIEKLSNPFMIWAITRKMKDTFKRNLDKFVTATHIHPPSVLSSKSIKEFDQHLTLKLLGKLPSEYYQSSSCHTHLQNIKIPTLLLNSHDDPIVHPELIDHPRTVANKNHNLILATTQYGGHLGWIQGGMFTTNKFTWAENVAVEFIEAVRAVQADRIPINTGT